MRGAATLALALAAIATPSANASTTIAAGSDTSAPYQQWINDAKIPTPDVEIAVLRGGCPVAEHSCTGPGAPIFLEEGASRGTFFHELGHQFDYVELDDAEALSFEAITGDPRPWISPPNSPHEQFAEAYRACERRRRLTRARFLTTGYHWHVSRKEFSEACHLIQSSHD